MDSTSETHADERVLVLTPSVRDADLMSAVIAQVGLVYEPCTDVGALCHAIAAGATAVVVPEEVLTPPVIARLHRQLEAEPAWSDLTLVVLTRERSGPWAGLHGLHVLEPLGNVILLGRPVPVMTLVSTLRAALRARRRQYEVRDHLAERARTEQALRASEARLTQLVASETAARREAEQGRAGAEGSNRAKDQFLATLSHELRSPLSAILTWAQMLRTGALDAEKTTRALESIERNARLQVRLIEDLLDISRITAGKLTLEFGVIDLTSVVEVTVEQARPAAETKGIVLGSDLTALGVRVRGDAARLQQVVTNLLSNAIKFTPEGGRVDVHLERVRSQARITVRDTGRGIAAEFLPHIFDRFRQADSSITRRYGGLGLGLAIVQHLVELHGGTVLAESAGVDGGATFTVVLPIPGDLLIPTEARPRSMADRAPVRDLHGITVLVVDDDTDAVTSMRMLFAAHGAAVATAGTAHAALALMQRARPDVLVSDIGMPDADGYTLLRQVRASGAETHSLVPAIAVTAYASPADRQRALAAGYQVHLPKPFDPQALVAAVAALAGRLHPLQ